MTSELWSDLKQALRMLTRSPGSSAFALLTLALGIAATTAVFTVVYDVLFRSLPFKDSGSLIVVNETNQKMGASRWPASPADFWISKFRVLFFPRSPRTATSNTIFLVASTRFVFPPPKLPVVYLDHSV